MSILDAKREQKKRSIWPLAVAIAIGLFIGFWGFAYQGYTEDGGVEPTQSWPIGVGGFLVAGVLAVIALRRARPSMTGAQTAIAAVCIGACLAVAAIGSLDAGQG